MVAVALIFAVSAFWAVLTALLAFLRYLWGDDSREEHDKEIERLRQEMERMKSERDEMNQKIANQHTEFHQKQREQMNDFIAQNNQKEAEYQQRMNEMKEMQQTQRAEEMKKINAERERIKLEYESQYDEIVQLSTNKMDEMKKEQQKERGELLQKLTEQQQANTKQIERIITENQNQYKELVENQQNQMNELLSKTDKKDAEYKQKIDEMTKKQSLEVLQFDLRFQMQAFGILYDKLQNDHKSIQNDIIWYNVQINDINNELKYMYKYHIDKVNNKNNDDGYNIVLLGQTGFHKSTFGNRICGDISMYGNKTCFTTSTGADSCTSETEKKIVKYLYPKPLSIIDTAGFFDPDHRDNRSVEDLVATLRGSGGINAFLFFGKNRFDETYQEILRNMTAIFDDQYHNFWRHIIFVRTGVEGIHRTEFSKWSEQFRQQVRKQFPYIDNTYNLTIFAVHTWRDYKKYIRQQFWKLIPENKFDCKAIESPFQKLRKSTYILEDHIFDKKLIQNEIKSELDKYYMEMMVTLNEIKKLNKAIYQINYQSINEKMKQSEQYAIFDALKQIQEEELSKHSSKYTVEVIDYSTKDFDKSILPLIIDDKYKTEIEQCNVGSIFKKFHETNPYSMMTVDTICPYIKSINSSCPLCPDFEGNYYLWQIKNNPIIIISLTMAMLAVVFGYFFYAFLDRMRNKKKLLTVTGA